MTLKIGDSFSKSIKSNLGAYFVVILFFAIGLSAGAFTIKSLDIKQKQELIVFFDKFLQIVGKDNVNKNTVFLQSIKNNAQTILILWLLGLTVIGIPFILVVLSFRGFITGFTITLLIQGMGWKGIIACIIAVIPQNIIYIPCLLMISVGSLNFSVNRLKRKLKKSYGINNKSNLLSYTMETVLFFVIMVIGSLIEAYVSPYILKGLSSYLLKK